MSKRATKQRFLTGVMSASVASLALTGLMAGPAGAAPSDSASSSAPIEAQASVPVTGGILADVNAASTEAEKRALLESNGYVNTTGNTYEATQAGFTIGYTIPQTPSKDIVSPQWSGGFDVVRPYVQGTLPEWQAAIDAGANPATIACAFITASVGAAACAVAIQEVNDFIQSQDVSSYEGLCIRYIPIGGTVKFVAC